MSHNSPNGASASVREEDALTHCEYGRLGRKQRQRWQTSSSVESAMIRHGL